MTRLLREINPPQVCVCGHTLAGHRMAMVVPDKRKCCGSCECEEYREQKQPAKGEK